MEENKFNDTLLPGGFNVMGFSEDLYTYTNYERLQQEAAVKGLVMKEDKDFYAYKILNGLKTLLSGKSKEELLQIATVMKYPDYLYGLFDEEKSNERTR